MNKRTEQYLAHAENRIRICRTNALLWADKDDQYLAEEARKGIYKWIGLAQENHQEDHF
jgi:hypothetical protein